MANIIRAVFAFFWLMATVFIGYLTYVVLMTEPDPHALWGWLVMCGFTFISVTFLAYNIIFGHHHRGEVQHHDAHLLNP
jgi:hypothetical protein